METKKSIGFGFRGWLLIIVLFFGFMMFQVFTNYPLNILADFYGGAEKGSNAYDNRNRNWNCFADCYLKLYRKDKKY